MVTGDTFATSSPLSQHHHIPTTSTSHPHDPIPHEPPDPKSRRRSTIRPEIPKGEANGSGSDRSPPSSGASPLWSEDELSETPSTPGTDLHLDGGELVVDDQDGNTALEGLPKLKKTRVDQTDIQERAGHPEDTRR